jgi:hypothetical protein
MAHLGTVFFRGRSGTRYRFDVWPLGTAFKPLAAVCLFTKRAFRNHNFSATASHECMHIGQTRDLSALSYDAGYASGSDCICIHVVADGEQRAACERDLAESLGLWSEAFRVDLEKQRPGASRAAGSIASGEG